tara:strand:+ start:784 stop:1380 length:597 start_codon:yes stop_codon:yes gene_type:complete
MDNLIQVFENSISSRVCENLIYKFEHNIDIKKGATIGGYNPKYKKTIDLTFGPDENIHFLELYNLLNSKLAYYINEYKNITNFQLPTNFICQLHMMMKYLKNDGHYNFHHDFHLLGTTKSDANDKSESCRILTYLFYLNTVDEGGETEFIDGTKIKPEKGKLLIFPATWPYVHKGNMPLSSNKYIVTGWLLLKNLNNN